MATDHVAPLERSELSANGLTFSILSCGTGPLVLCAHGFPETGETFAPTLRHVAGRGFRGVAPNMRGYWPSTVAGPQSFHVNALAEDLVAIAAQLSPAEPAVLVGHDWGAYATYRAAVLSPARFRKIVTIGIPHVAMVRRSLSLAWAMRHFVEFQARDHALAKLRADDFAYVDALYRRWSPSWAFGPEETAAVKEAFRHEGCLEAAVAYYGSFISPTPDEAKRGQALDRERVPVPATIVLGASGAGPKRRHVAEKTELFPRGLEVVWVDGAGHFVHRERPEAWLAVLDRVLAG